MDQEKQIQRELFEEFDRQKKRRFPKSLFFQKARRTVTLSSEQLLFIAIAVVIVGILFFVVCVLRGKRISASPKEALLPAYAETAKEQEAVPELTQTPQPSTKKGPEKSKGEAGQKEKEPKRQDLVDKAKYIIQVASYTKESDAKNVVEQLVNKGIKSSIYLSGKYYMVYIGEFEKK